MRLSLVPQRREFYELYNRAATNAVEISRLLVRMLDHFPNDRDTLTREIKDAEHEGDRLTHDGAQHRLLLRLGLLRLRVVMQQVETSACRDRDRDRDRS